jgi:hypothetical protein
MRKKSRNGQRLKTCQPMFRPVFHKSKRSSLIECSADLKRERKGGLLGRDAGFVRRCSKFWSRRCSSRVVAGKVRLRFALWGPRGPCDCLPEKRSRQSLSFLPSPRALAACPLCRCRVVTEVCGMLVINLPFTGRGLVVNLSLFGRRFAANWSLFCKNFLTARRSRASLWIFGFDRAQFRRVMRPGFAPFWARKGATRHPRVKP